jgi:polar amino acid transport system substrate-binding protein
VAVTPNAALAVRDPATGEWRGPWLDLAGALARRLGVPVALVEYGNIGAAVAAAETGAWDVASDVRSPEEAALDRLAAAVPYLEVEYTLLVGPDSPLRSTADADQPGVRIAAPVGTPPELRLTALLRQAQVVRAANSAEAVALLRAGQVEAAAATRANLLALAAQVPGARVLADPYAVQENRIILPPGRPAAGVALASDVTRQALTSGLIRASIERHGVVGVRPAALAAPGGLPRTGGAASRPAWTAVAGLAAAAGLLVTTRRRPRR